MTIATIISVITLAVLSVFNMESADLWAFLSLLGIILASLLRFQFLFGKINGKVLELESNICDIKKDIFALNSEMKEKVNIDENNRKHEETRDAIADLKRSMETNHNELTKRIDRLTEIIFTKLDKK